MSPGGLALELFKSVPYGKRALLVVKQSNVDELFNAVNWDTALANVEKTFGGPQIKQRSFVPVELGMTSRSSRAPKRQKLEEEPAAGSYNYNYAAAGYSFPGYVGYQWPAQQASPYALPAAYSYAATYGYGSAYYAAAAAAAAVQAGAGEETETESAVGKKGDYENLLQEMKAKQAARAAGDSQQEVQDKKRFRLPSDGSADQFGRLGRAVSTSLRAAEGASLSLQQLCEDKRIHQEWKELEKSGLVKPNSQLKTFLLERATSFEVSSSPSGQAVAREQIRESFATPRRTPRRVMAAARARSGLLASLLVSLGLVSLVFVPGPRAEAPSLRGLAGAASIAAAPGVASAADEYLNYNMTGEFTPFMVIGYFGLTTFLTAFAFGSYLVLTKLKII
ncbi:hypothetical protein AK812_SmicGene30895 [Symbiodinium microadriaticum]|uniref:Uncharacterized protein n=1 Tax=Symbiodinium microadriaticum TaxID=2951 RepID=A0A1Q9CY84_SYMMI|nr:hypothetical protein AK812_SmicGene30895 [Symbiodinium microadriaticum]